WPWTQIVRALIEENVRVSEYESVALSAIAPDLRSPVEPVPAFQTYEALLSLLKRAAHETPRVFVLDDLHAADRSTLLGLEHIARSLRSLRVLLIGTHREAEARVKSGVHEVLERIAREGTRFTLARLAESEVRALLSERIGATGASAARSVHQTTEGNPLFV